jgi:hypothetical protein
VLIRDMAARIGLTQIFLCAAEIHYDIASMAKFWVLSQAWDVMLETFEAKLRATSQLRNKILTKH